jgi:hypothetical protein
MTVYWIRTESNSAFSAMEAVERALAEGDTGTPATSTRPAESAEAAVGDPYLAENLAAIRAIWSIDPHRIVISRRPVLAGMINRFQRFIRRGTWWYALPQWQQISEFHGAATRVVEVLLENQRQLREQAAAAMFMFTPLGRTQALEEQLQLLRMDLMGLQNRVAELEEQLTASAPQDEDEER